MITMTRWSAYLFKAACFIQHLIVMWRNSAPFGARFSLPQPPIFFEPLERRPIAALAIISPPCHSFASSEVGSLQMRRSVVKQLIFLSILALLATAQRSLQALILRYGVSRIDTNPCLPLCSVGSIAMFVEFVFSSIASRIFIAKVAE